MRRSALSLIPINKDVCIFCTTRLQFASTRPKPRPRPQFFSSTGAPRRPPAAAAARKEEQDDQGWNMDWKTKPLPKETGGGWASNTAVRDLTPEEQALRNALQKQPAFTPPIPERDSRAEPRQEFRAQERGNVGVRHGQSSGSDRLRRYRNGDDIARATPVANEYYRKSSHDQKGLFRRTDPQSHERQRLQIPKSRSDTSDAATLRSRADRDAHLDRHIAQSATLREGDWGCPNCGFNNLSRNRRCLECAAIRPEANNRKVEIDDLHAQNWKHLKRRSDVAVEQREQVEEPNKFEQAEESNKADVTRKAQTHARIEAAERERMMRLERTRDGKYVSFRKEQDSSKQNVVARKPQQMSQRAATPVQKAQPPSSESKASDGWVTWEPFPTSESRDDQQETEKSAPSPSPAGGLEGWDYPVEEPAPAEGRLEATDSGQTLTTKQLPEQRSPVRKHMSYDNDYDPNRGSNQPDRAGSSGTRGPGREASRSGIELTSMPSGRNRYKERKSKSFVSEVDFDEDDEDVLRAKRREQRKQKVGKGKAFQKAAAPPIPIYLPEFISVSNLAAVLRVRVEDFAYKMKDLGFAETNNDHVLDAETAGLIASEFNYEPIIERSAEKDLLPLLPAEDKSILPARPPVVTIMGHVDHGKTTLLDYLRKSSVAASEHGGITQHIGAFSVPMPGGRLVTFLDTPGHEAFLSMRQRGANVTDIVILVVAADDSVKPQTVEAIKHAQAAKVPIIVAINKIDKEDSNVEKVKGDLARYGVEIEDYGGDTQVVCVSGKTGQGMEELEDAAVALADILDMRSEIDGQAEGWVLEATTKKAGRVATVLVRRGTLRPGNVIVAGTSWARVRSLRNEAGAMVPSAGPGTPVEIDGWREQPAAGDEVIQAPDEQKAKSVIEYRLEASERTKMAADMEAVNEARRLEQEKRDQLEKAAQLADTDPDAISSSLQPEDTTAPAPPPPTSQEVFFIIKADVSGSVEAITDSVSALGNPEVRPHILRTGVGPLTEFDIDHAAVAKGHIINFNTPIDGSISRLAESKDVKIIDQNIIYRLVDEVKAMLGERLKPVVTQRVLGEAEVARVFEINTKGRVVLPVAGCKVRNGVVSKTGRIRVLRGKEVAFDGILSSLKNVKKDVPEMRKGNECGMSFENWTGFQVGDQVQAYEEVVEKRVL